MKELAIYSLENFWTYKYDYFSEFHWAAASANTPANKSMSKVDKKDISTA